MNVGQEPELIRFYVRISEADEKTNLLETAQRLVNDIKLTEWWAWFEPFPGLRLDRKPGRAEDFEPWTKCWPDPAKTPPLAEIRLGGRLSEGQVGGCHLVQDEDGTVRWFAFSERSFNHATPIKSVQKLNPYSVLQRRDAKKRFFVDNPSWLKKNRDLEMIEYWAGERLLAWLVMEKES